MSLKNNKSPGVDNIPAEFLKHNTSDNLVKDITLLFNYILESAEFPDFWCEGLRNPIFKSGSRCAANNYRGITVLPIFEKIFEILIQKRLEFIDTAFKMQDPHNAGFQKNSRTADNIFFLKSLIEKQLIMGKNLIVIFVDFSQAFDRINRAILFFKIDKLGLKGRLIDVLKSIYSKTSFRVKQGGKISEKLFDICGVNQGGNASPILFKKYMQDLISYLDEYTGVNMSTQLLVHRSWADDLFLVSTQNSDAQSQLNGLIRFCSPNQMVVNNVKTKVMTFGKPLLVNLKLNGTTLEVVQSYKSLGILINSTKTITANVFKLHPDYLVKQAKKAAFSIFNKTKQIGNIPPKYMLFLYQSMIQPVLLYGSEIWGFHKAASETVDKFYLWFARTILNVKASTSNVITLGECGVLPPGIICHINCILYAIRLKDIQHDDVLRCIFNQNLQLHDLGFNTWYSKVFSLANSYGIDLREMSYSDSTKRIIKEKISNSFLQKWHHDLCNLEDNPLLRTYVLFKRRFALSSHLIHVKNNLYRNAISKIRCSSHLLHIERGRHNRPKTALEKRVCAFCSTMIENEIHFICDCSIYTNIRTTFFSKVISLFPNFEYLNSQEKFKFLSRNETPILLTWLGQFILNAFELRDQKMKEL